MERKIERSAEPVRLFQSDLLEWFTHIHPAVIVGIWLPVAALFLVRGVTEVPEGASALTVPAAFLGGLLAWTLAEYAIHRFVFHYEARSRLGKRVMFLFHEIHHVQPDCKTRLVMPPVVSIPLAVLFYGGFHLILARGLHAPAWVDPAFAGFLAGYLVYDLTHYATHHLPMRGRVLKALKRHHMAHHYKCPDRLFGVSSPLWDVVFGTREPRS